ncbi:hypothetical protein [Streptococcus pneumoniae]|uniref:hypothetical protein n=1 Tax=Streptococcus pneumoniae TaxID=1313 RepID=UPI001CB77513|nr:hypothetical protein [Streptococcus pneumoniae]
MAEKNATQMLLETISELKKQHRDHQRHVENNETSTTRTKNRSRRAKDKDAGFELG